MTGTSTIKVLYFGQVAELTGLRDEIWPLAQSLSAADWLTQLETRYPQLAPVSRLKLAVNQVHAPASTQIHAGDEVAVFEPVTGG